LRGSSLALFYLLATLFVFWAISNHVGDAERAVGLVDTPEGWKRGWWPVVFAFCDVAATTAIVFALTLTLIAGVQLFDGIAAARGAEPILPLDDVFEAIATDEWDAKNWWIYTLLLSTYLPSLANLMIGGAAFFGSIWLIWNVALPQIGFELFEIAGEFESANLPAKAIAFFARRP